jgi:hypothetical protein
VNDYCNKCAKPINGLLPLHKFNGFFKQPETLIHVSWLIDCQIF